MSISDVVDAVMVFVSAMMLFSVGYLCGHAFGKQSGHAEGWLDRWFQEQAERQPRNARGQFAERVSGGRN